MCCNSHSDNVRGSTCATADFHQLAVVASLSLSRTVAIDSRQLASHLFCLLPTTYTHTKTRQRFQTGTKVIVPVTVTGTTQTKKLQKRLLAVLYILRERHTNQH